MVREQRDDHQTRGRSVPIVSESAVIAAHELKSPLALIRQLSFELERGELDQREYLRIVEQIRLTSERALRLSADLTRTAQLQRSLFTTEPVNVEDVCSEVVREMMPLYQAHQRVVRRQVSRRTPLVVANRDLLRRIVVNFVDNALHYADEQSATEIFVRQLRRNETVRVGVRDRGPALSRGNAYKKVTGIEQVTDNYRAMRPESSGLGLWITRQFAEAIDGTIGMTHHRDGLSFYIDIPISKQLSLL